MPAPFGPTTAMVVPGPASRARRVNPVTSACSGQGSDGRGSGGRADGSGSGSGAVPAGSSGRPAARCAGSRWSPGVPVQRPRNAISTIIAMARSSSDTEVAASGESWSSRYTWSGRVCVVPGRFPAKVMVAPNSPSARAQVRAAPAISPGATIGSVTVRKTRTGDAPRDAAVSSYRGRSPPSAPSSEITRNGIATNVAATTAPEVWKGSVIPKVSSSHGPSSPRRPNASSSATPPTVGGSTMGSSTRERTNALPGNGTRASSQASGTPSSSESPSAHRETSSESRSASVVASAVRWSPSSPQEVRARMPTSGSIRNATASRAGTVSNRGARAPGVRRRAGRLMGDLVGAVAGRCGWPRRGP